MATAAKAKLLLRELKTLKADLAFAKQRCSQLEEENKMLRESREKGSNVEDDDLVMHSCTSLCFLSHKVLRVGPMHAVRPNFVIYALFVLFSASFCICRML